jgi:hypothetical protein
MAKWKITKEQTIIYKTLQGKERIEQKHEPFHKQRGEVIQVMYCYLVFIQ